MWIEDHPAWASCAPHVSTIYNITSGLLFRMLLGRSGLIVFSPKRTEFLRMATTLVFFLVFSFFFSAIAYTIARSPPSRSLQVYPKEVIVIHGRFVLSNQILLLSRYTASNSDVNLCINDPIWKLTRDVHAWSAALFALQFMSCGLFVPCR